MKFLILLGVMFVSTSCATILHGTKQLISIVTHPAGAKVQHGTITLTTPVKLELERKKDHVITISKPGYETQVIQLIRTANGAAAEMILPGGLIAYGIDRMTGADCDLKPEKVDLMLRRQPIWKMLFKSQVNVQTGLVPKLPA